MTHHDDHRTKDRAELEALIEKFATRESTAVTAAEIAVIYNLEGVAVGLVAAAAEIWRSSQLRTERPDWTRPGQDDALRALRAVPAVRQRLIVQERELIDTARRNGATWDQIAEALGYTGAQARGAAAVRFTRDLGGPPAIDPELADAAPPDQDGAT